MGALTRWLLPRQEFRGINSAEILRALRSEASDINTPTSAMKIAAVYACVRVIATAIATLPLVVMRRQGDRRDPAEDHPLYEILAYQPNPEMTSVQFRMALSIHLVLHGNAFAQIVRNGAGRVLELWPLRPDRVRLERSPTGALLYRYALPTGGEEYLPQAEVLHVAHMPFDGLIGLSPITIARSVFDTKQRMEEYAAAFWQNGAAPGVVLRYPGTLSAERRTALREAWEERHRGAGAAGRTAVLDGGAEISTLTLAQADAQFLESQKFTRQEIAALFGVPAHMINDLDRATFSNIEEQAQEFIDNTLLPYLNGWEQAIRRDLLTEQERRAGYYPHFRTQALLRAKHADRAQFYNALQMAGALSPNDIRRLEDMNPIAAGDLYLVQRNMISVQAAVAGETMDSKDAPRAADVASAWLADMRQRLENRIANDVRQAGAKALRVGGEPGLAEWRATMSAEWRSAAERMLVQLRRVAPGASADIDAWIDTAYQSAAEGLSNGN